MATSGGTRERVALTVVLSVLGGLLIWFAGFVPYRGGLEDTDRRLAETSREIAEEKQTEALIAEKKRRLAALDGRALHLEPAETDQHCQQLLYKWAAAGNLENALVRTLRPSRLAGSRWQRSYSLTGGTTLEGVRGILYAMRTDPADRGIRRLRRLDMTPASTRSPEKLRVTLNVDWLVSGIKGLAPATRPAPAPVRLTRYDGFVDRAMFTPYAPPRRVVITPPTPEPERRRDPRRRQEPRKERWQLSLVADAGTGPEAEFLGEQHLQVKRLTVGDRLAGYRVHKIDLDRKAVVFRQGDLLFEVGLGAFFDERKVIGKSDAPPADTGQTRRDRGKRDRN